MKTTPASKETSRGISLIEVVVGASIVFFVLLSTVTALQLYIVSSRANLDRIQAAYLLEGGVEIVRFIRDKGYTAELSALAKDTPYCLVFEGGTWKATTTETLIDGSFRRTAALRDVYRRLSDRDIVASTSPDTKEVDPETTEVVVSVAWGTEASKELEAVTYLTNLFGN